MRLGHVLVGSIAAAIVVLGVLYEIRDAEDRTLDDAARAVSGGEYVTLSDGITHYDVTGPDSGTPVVLVHGFSVPFYIWDTTAVALAAAGYRVLRYDLFGRGYSDRPDVTYDANLFDRQLGELMDSTGYDEPVHLMGLSMGGAVAGTFSGRHTQRVRSLTLVDPAAGEPGGLPWYLRAPVLGPMLWQVAVVPEMAEGQLGDFVDPNRWPDWPDRYRVQMQYRGFGRALRSTVLEARGVDRDSLYRTVAGLAFPVLLIWGEEDRTVPISLSAGVRQAIPRAQFHPIERAGHLPQMERPDVVNPLLLRFLQSADSAVATRRE